MSVQKRVVLVTGGMGGLGTAICKAFHSVWVGPDKPYVVVANCLPNFPHKDEWLQRTSDEWYNFKVAEADVSDFEQCVAMVAKIEAEIGPVDVLVNNAGITRDAPLRKMDKDMWDAVMATNLDSLYNMTKPVLDGMVARGWGRIINISSVNGEKGQFGQANYSAAKAGLIGFTKAIAQEVAKKGVTANAIAPGYIATEMVMAIPEEHRNKIVATIPMGRLGKPEEVGNLCSYLASDAAAYITGATFDINGGLYMR